MSSTRKLQLVIGGLLVVAVALVVLTVLYVRHTRPDAGATATVPEADDDRGETPEVEAEVASAASVGAPVGASSAVPPVSTPSSPGAATVTAAPVLVTREELFAGVRPDTGEQPPVTSFDASGIFDEPDRPTEH